MQGSIRFPKYENENPKYFLTQNPKYFSKVTAKFKINFQNIFSRARNFFSTVIQKVTVKIQNTF